MGFWPLYGTFCSHLPNLPSCFARRRYVTFKVTGVLVSSRPQVSPET